MKNNVVTINRITTVFSDMLCIVQETYGSRLTGSWLHPM